MWQALQYKNNMGRRQAQRAACCVARAFVINFEKG